MASNYVNANASGNGDKRQEGTNQTEKVVDRAVVKNFQPRSAVNPATGMGSKENPGKPI